MMPPDEESAPPKSGSPAVPQQRNGANSESELTFLSCGTCGNLMTIFDGDLVAAMNVHIQEYWHKSVMANPAVLDNPFSDLPSKNVIDEPAVNSFLPPADADAFGAPIPTICNGVPVVSLADKNEATNPRARYWEMRAELERKFGELFADEMHHIIGNVCQICFVSIPRRIGLRSIEKISHFLTKNHIEKVISKKPKGSIASHLKLAKEINECLNYHEMNAVLCDTDVQALKGFIVALENTLDELSEECL